MTFEKLQEIIEKNNIPKDVHLMSDSGWECDATKMNGVFYDKDGNTIVFTQNDRENYPYNPSIPRWKNLNPVYNYCDKMEE